MKKLVFALFLSVFTAAAWGYSAGTTGVFDIGLGVRAQSMGSAGTAVPDDSSAIYYNQSALQTLRRAEVQAAYFPLFFDTVYNFLAAAMPTIEFGTFGISAARFSTEGIMLRDSKGFALGQVSQGMTEITGAWGRDFFDESIMLGAGLKVDHVSFGEKTDTSFGLDLSALYSVRNETDGSLRAGLCVRNVIEPEIKLGTAQDNHPRLVTAGVSWAARPAGSFSYLAAVDLTAPYNSDMLFFAGAEAVFFGVVSARAGYNSYEVLSVGAGIEALSFVSVDYGMFAAPLDTSHRFSLKFKLGEDAPEARKNKEAGELKKIERKAREMAMQELQDLRKSLDRIRQETTKREYFKALHYSRGLEAYYGGDLQKSVIEFDTVYKADPDYMNTRYYYSLVKNVIKREKTQDYPEEVLVLYRAGVEKYLKEDYSGAKEEWEKILKVDPYNKLAIENLKEVNSLLRDIEKLGE